MFDNIDLEEIEILSEKYSISKEDLFFCVLNIEGINCKSLSNRVRFGLSTIENSNLFNLANKLNIRNYYVALAVNKKSRFSISKDNFLLFKNKKMAKIKSLLDDYCDASYPRKGGKIMNFNPNSSSLCKGCKFCYTSNQIVRDRKQIISEEEIQFFIEKWLKRFKLKDLSTLEQIALVTGCFSNEQYLINYLKKIRHIFGKYNFHKEILYFGSQVVSEDGLAELERIKPIAYYFSIECFDRRSELLRDKKRKVSLEQIKLILKSAKNRGIKTTFSYILGLEDLEIVKKRFIEFSDLITNFPVINIFQLHKNSSDLRVDEARKIEYYIKFKKFMENLFENKIIRPAVWENYRSPWHLMFGNEVLKGERIPLDNNFRESLRND